MPPAPHVEYSEPEEVVGAFEACPRLAKAGVRHYLAEKLDDQGLATESRCIWRWTNFEMGPPKQIRDTGQPFIVEEAKKGEPKREYYAERKFDCQVTAEVRLRIDVNGKLTRFEFLKLFALAACDVLRIEAAMTMAGSFTERQALGDSHLETVCTLKFRLPIYDLKPVARVADDSVALET